MKSFYIVLYYVPLEMAHIIQYLKFFTTKHFVFFFSNERTAFLLLLRGKIKVRLNC